VLAQSPLVLVTGASGFVGSHVCRAALARSWRVVGLRRNTTSVPTESAINWITGPVCADTFARLAQVPDVIIHCAGGAVVARSFVSPIGDFNDTVSTTAELLNYLKQHAPQTRLVYVSSAAVYGAAVERENSTICEGCPPNPVSPYGIHKLSSEQLIAQYSKLFGLQSIRVRLFSIYGPGLRKQLLWDACGKLLCKQSIFAGTGEEVRDWLHVDDAAQLIASLWKHANITSPVINAGSGHGSRVREVIERLAVNLKCLSGVIFDGSVRPGDPRRYVADISLANRLGWAPRVPMAEGLDAYTRWYLSQVAPA
jgi:UDP-glucose 4-epimerase